MSTISGSISFAGLGSGTDFQALVEQLKEIESIPKQRLEYWREDWQLRYDAFSQLLITIEESNSILGEMSTMSKILDKAVSSSNSTVASATADADAADTTNVITVKQLATNATLTNQTVFESKDLGVSVSGEAVFSYTYNGERRDITIPKGMTLEGMVDMINKDATTNEVDVKASLLSSGSGYIFQFQGTETGEENSLVINANTNVTGFEPSNITGSTTYTNGDTESTRNMVVRVQNADGTYSYVVGESLLEGSQQYSGEWNSESGATQTALEFEYNGYSFSSVKENTFRTATAVASGEFVDPFSFTYNGETYNGAGTLESAVDDIKAQAGSALNVQIVDDGTGKFFIDITPTGKVDQTVTAIEPPIGSALASEDSPVGLITITKADGTEKSYGTDYDASGGRTSLQDLVDEINADTSSGLTATIVGNTGSPTTYTLRVTEAVAAPADATLTFTEADGVNQQKTLTEIVDEINGAKGITGTLGAEAVKNQAGNYELRLTGVTDPSALTTTTAGASFGEARATVNEQIADINREASVSGVVASLTANPDGTYAVSLQSNELSNVTLGFGMGTDAGFTADSSATSSGSGSTSWYMRQAQDAIFTLNGLDLDMTSASNQLTGVIEGVTVNLTSVGTTNLTVTTDTTALREKVEEFVETMNTILTTFQELTKVDEDKEVEEIVDAEGNHSVSLYAAQMGSVLTGNYGVTLLNSQLKTMMTSRAIGFEDDDLFSSLSSIGITIDADEGSPTFGQMQINDSDDILATSVGKGLDTALAEDPFAVAEMLAGFSASSTSSEVMYESMLSGVTQAGSYEVTYDVDADGNVSNVMLGGQAATLSSSATNTYTMMDGPAKGLAFSIQDLTAGSHPPADADPIYINVKQGKISELYTFLADQSRNDPADLENGERGTLQVLKDNYLDIMDSIDDKIADEERRLALWERRELAKFARIDTILAEYEATQATLESELAQLG